MSSGAEGGAGRVSIPSGAKKTIENIKEFTGQNHSEDEIYAMLKECSMDPNETTQKLLNLDTFREVKRKRDRRKENQNKEPADLKWKPGTQARANRGSRGNYSSRYISDDVGVGRSSAAVKENAGLLGEKGTSKAPLGTSQDMKKKESSSVSSPATAVSNGPSGITSKSSTVIPDNHASVGGGVGQTNTTASVSKSDGPIPPSSLIDSDKKSNALEKDAQMQELSNSAVSIPSATASGSYFSPKDPVLLPSQDSPLATAVGVIRREVGNQRAAAKLIDDNPTESKSASAKIEMTESKAAIGLSWQPKVDFLSSAKNEKSCTSEAESSALYRPNSQLVDGLYFPPNDPRKLNKLFKKQVKDIAGKNWFDMPAQTITPELKKDLQLLKLRGAIDPKRHYKKGDSKSKSLPKYFQVGTVIESTSEFYAGRLTKKERKATLADELLSNGTLREYRKRKVREIEEVNRPGGVGKWKNKKSKKHGKKRRY